VLQRNSDIHALPSETLSQTLDFAAESRSCCQPNSPTTVELVYLLTHCRCYTLTAHTVYCMVVDRNAPKSNLRICRTTCFYSCKAVDKISTDIARRAVRLRQQSSCCESHVRVTAHRIFSILFLMTSRWLASRVVSVLDSGAEGPGFKSQSRCCRVTVLGKLFTPIVPLFTKQRNWQQPS